MTDRELLELAAKAAGIEGSQCDWKTPDSEDFSETSHENR